MNKIPTPALSLPQPRTPTSIPIPIHPPTPTNPIKNLVSFNQGEKCRLSAASTSASTQHLGWVDVGEDWSLWVRITTLFSLNTTRTHTLDSRDVMLKYSKNDSITIVSMFVRGRKVSHPTSVQRDSMTTEWSKRK